MKSETLHALLIDHHAGELPAEVSELLESYLASHAAAREEAEKLMSVIELTRQTIHRHPELVRTFEQSLPQPSLRAKPLPVWLKVAAAVVFAALTSASGYLAGVGRTGTGVRAAGVASATPLVRKDSPWARYRMETDLAGRMQVVRIDSDSAEGRP